MDTFEASFEIDSKTDAFAVERLLDRLYDSLREETRSRGSDSGDSTETLSAFDELRDAAASHSPGRLTVTYERRDEGFE